MLLSTKQCILRAFQIYGTTRPSSKVFSRYEIEGSVYVARNKNRRNLNFGFLRLEPHYNVGWNIKQLNTIEIGSRHLMAFVARHPNPPTSVSKSQVSMKVHNPPKEPKASFIPSNRDGRTYAAVTAGNRNNQETKNSLTFEYGKSTIWSKHACLVKVRDIEVVPKLDSILIETNYAIEFVAPAGGFFAITVFF